MLCRRPAEPLAVHWLEPWDAIVDGIVCVRLRALAVVSLRLSSVPPSTIYYYTPSPISLCMSRLGCV